MFSQKESKNGNKTIIDLNIQQFVNVPKDKDSKDNKKKIYELFLQQGKDSLIDTKQIRNYPAADFFYLQKIKNFIYFKLQLNKILVLNWKTLKKYLFLV